MSDPAAALRAEFPVLERLSYLNAGSNGPVPRRAADAAREALVQQADEGRGGKAFFMRVMDGAQALRTRVAAIARCEPGELALTGSTTDGINAALLALDLGPDDEVLTSDEEHPGVLAPLNGLRKRRGVQVRVAPFHLIAEEVGPNTTAVAVSHVSWHTGRVVDHAALAQTGVPVVLDGAQSLGAIPVDVHELGCDFYAAAGQKWMCGPVGLGYLYVRGERAAKLTPPWPWFGSMADPANPLDGPFHEDARRFDMGIVPPENLAWALGALDVLEEPGMAEGQERARNLAARLAARLAERGLTVAPRGESTLVSWQVADPQAEAERLLDEEIMVRHLPGTPYVRASVGAWTTEEELERLVATSGS